MSRLTIDVTEQQHQTLKTLAALERKTIKQYALERLFPESLDEQNALQELKNLLAERIAQSQHGELVCESITDLAEKEINICHERGFLTQKFNQRMNVE